MKKSILTAFLAFFMLVFLPSLRTQAESQDGFMLDGTGAVTLQSQHAAKEEVSSLQFSLTVETEGEAQVEFVFEPNHARIAEFRYDEAAWGNLGCFQDCGQHYHRHRYSGRDYHYG